MFKGALSTIVKRWEEPKCPPIEEQRNKMWEVHTMEYYFAIEMIEIVTPATTWVTLMLRPRTIPSGETFRTGKSIEIESRCVVVRS